MINPLAAATGPETVALLVTAAVAIALFVYTHFRHDSRAAIDFALLALRLPLGAFFILVARMKFAGGVGHFVAQSGGAIPPWVTPGLANAYLYCVPYAEMIVGICLIIGLLARPIALIATLMIVSFTIAVTGVVVGPAISQNVVYIGVAIAIMLLGPGRVSVDTLIPYPGRRKKK